jgi:hypothetical protein
MQNPVFNEPISERTPNDPGGRAKYKLFKRDIISECPFKKLKGEIILHV